MNNTIKPLLERLKRGERVVETVICGHSGSTPRSAGASMLVFEDGSIAGTIGGGLVEASVQRLAEKMLGSAPDSSTDSAALCAFDLSNELAAQADLICGGSLQVCLQLLSPGDAGVEAFEKTQTALDAGRKALLCTDLGPENTPDSELRVGRRWALVDGEDSGDFLDREGLEQAQAMGKSGGAGMFTWKGRRILVVPHIESGSLVLVGAGHVAQHTALAAARVGFRIVVMDDREEFANQERFPDAAQLVVLPDFQDCFKDVPLDGNSFVVVVTRGHLHDKTALGQTLRANLPEGVGYIGMIGSRRKRDAIYDALCDEGFDRSEFERVHCPIGLSIGAETPEEIAVSITGELIRERALRRGTSKSV